MRTALLPASLLALAALALAVVPSASATCVTVDGSGVCVEAGGTGTGPGVVPTGGRVCVDSYCPTVGPVPYTCLVTVGGRGIFDAELCVGYPSSLL